MRKIVIEKTPLELWTSRKISGKSAGVLTQKQIETYQLDKLRETLAYVRQRSPFYQRQLAEVDCQLSSLEDIAKLPYTTADDLRLYGQEMICVRPSDIHRIVTLQTSGTTGQPKRVFFTEEDQELTIDFFHHGMLTFVEPGDRVLILLPGKVPGSVGELLRQGLARAGVEGMIHGPVSNPETALEQIIRDKVNVLVGIPIQVLAIARISKRKGGLMPHLRGILLTTDHVPNTIVKELMKVWGCPVFNHYGMTEMGLGGGVDCQGFNGYHLREADLYFEIIDPYSGHSVPMGQTGEVVFTTLTRTGMPLIRYRTGDYSRFLPEVCPCGTVLRRLERVRSRDRVILDSGAVLSMADLDEVLFSFDEVLNFSASIAKESGETVLSLDVDMDMEGAAIEKTRKNVLGAIQDLPIIKAALSNGSLKLSLTLNIGSVYCSGNGTGKRTIKDGRG